MFEKRVIKRPVIESIGKVKVGGNMSHKKIKIFYSSKTGPELSFFYSEGISYLQYSEMDVDLIDISEKPKKTNEFDITTTPTALVEKESRIHKELGVVSYFGGDLVKSEVKKLVRELEEN